MTSSNTVALAAKRRARQAGLTLAETLLVLAIGALAIVGGTLLYLQATAGNKLNTGINQFVTLQSGIRSLYAGTSNFDDLDKDLLIDANAAPSDMVAGTQLRNSWGGEVTAGTAAGGQQFTVTFNGVPNNACVKLITLNPGGSGGSGLVQVKVKAKVFAGADIPVQTLPAVTACDSGAADSNTITWTFN
ncbi:MAG: type 4 pilus major pilin [Pseudomonadota bacterium]